jgi:hypothetical protein
MGGHVACMGEMRNAYNIWVGKPEGKKPLGKPRRRWEGNIRMRLRETGAGIAQWCNARLYQGLFPGG